MTVRDVAVVYIEAHNDGGEPRLRHADVATAHLDNACISIDGGNQIPTGVSLIDDLTRDTNLRAFYTTPPDHTIRTGLFMPLADGIMNAGLKDFDDYPHLSGGLRASLCVEGGTWPGLSPLPACLLPVNLL